MIKSIPLLRDVKYSDRFERQLKKASDEIKEAFVESLLLFIEDPEHPYLRNHALKVKFTGYRSIDITGDWRAVFKEKRSGKQRVITFYLLGTHKNLYGT